MHLNCGERQVLWFHLYYTVCLDFEMQEFRQLVLLEIVQIRLRLFVASAVFRLEYFEIDFD